MENVPYARKIPIIPRSDKGEVANKMLLILLVSRCS